jgi:uncharacterized protein DUF6265
MTIAHCAVVALLAAEPASRIDQLSWMAGSWQGRQGEVEMEESWTAPKGGSMLGLHRDVKQGRTLSFEFLRIAEDKDGIVYHASPEGRSATPFRLVEASRERALFANPEHDFPQRILYWKDAEGALHARIEGTQGGKPASMEWRWTRSAP